MPIIREVMNRGLGEGLRERFSLLLKNSKKEDRISPAQRKAGVEEETDQSIMFFA